MEEKALMFFALSKTVAFLFLPSNLLIILGLAGALLVATRWRRAGLGILVASTALLAAAGFLPIGSALIHILETRFPAWNDARGAPDGIVILGGAISSKLSRAYGRPVIENDSGRIVALAQLVRAYPDARIVYSGGNADFFAPGVPETEFVRPLLEGFGIPRERVILEGRSRNTAENAAFTKELVNPKRTERWLLVTSAVHMPRAIGCFRQAGFQVEAYPVGWRTTQRLELMEWTLSAGLHRLDLAAYEWIGLLAYRLTGRTAAIFPSP
jgi:uncharacterized SAM-binding protein YcdF (DUF218 family)